MEKKRLSRNTFLLLTPETEAWIKEHMEQRIQKRSREQFTELLRKLWHEATTWIMRHF